MKIHTLALCLAGMLASGVAADHEDRASTRNGMNGRHHHRVRGDVNDWNRVYLVEHRFYRTVLFPELQPEGVVAEKVAHITENNRREAAELRALADRARAAGWTNIAMVYDHMVGDHSRAADFTTAWLVRNDFATPPEPTITLAADMDPHESIHHMIRHHEESFNRSIEMRRNEPSSTVRGLHLVTASTAARHISLLRMLDRDVELNRKALSARLEWELSPTYVASNFNQLMTRIEEEDRVLFQRTTTAQVPPQPEPVVVERIVEVEKIVEKPVVVERIVERVVEKPVYVERIVYRDRPVTRSRVAGSRSAVRSRRPAR